jgi:hypothetical protein
MRAPEKPEEDLLWKATDQGFEASMRWAMKHGGRNLARWVAAARALSVEVAILGVATTFAVVLLRGLREGRCHKEDIEKVEREMLAILAETSAARTHINRIIPMEWKASSRNMPKGIFIGEPPRCSVQVFTESADPGLAITFRGNGQHGPEVSCLTLSPNQALKLARVLVGVSGLMEAEVKRMGGGRDFEGTLDPEDNDYPAEKLEPILPRPVARGASKGPPSIISGAMLNRGVPPWRKG